MIFQLIIECLLRLIKNSSCLLCHLIIIHWILIMFNWNMNLMCIKSIAINTYWITWYTAKKFISYKVSVSNEPLSLCIWPIKVYLKSLWLTRLALFISNSTYYMWPLNDDYFIGRHKASHKDMSRLSLLTIGKGLSKRKMIFAFLHAFDLFM